MSQTPSSSSSSSRRSRRERRQQERLTFFSLSSLFVIGLAAGLAGALYLAWVLYPLDTTTASPAVFRADFKEDYIYMVSQSYAADGNWEKAQQRLALLQDGQLPQTVVAQLERYLRDGRPAESIRNLANLADPLGAQGTALDLFAPTLSSGEVAALIPTATATPDPAAGTAVATPTLLPTPTRNPTRTPPPTSTPAVDVIPSPTAPPSFRLLSQDKVCQPETETPDIQVVVFDALLENELAGVEILVSWVDGEDRFLTGFKPGQSAGYGDFTMMPDISYTVQIADGSGQVSGLRIEPCDGEAGSAGWLLQYQNLISNSSEE